MALNVFAIGVLNKAEDTDVRERWQVGSSLQHGPLERSDEKGSSLRDVLKGICQFWGII